jgi:hypothetical protein
MDLGFGSRKIRPVIMPIVSRYRRHKAAVNPMTVCGQVSKSVCSQLPIGR